jgi:predicted transposase/invertase (TIGR01784 family)
LEKLVRWIKFNSEEKGREFPEALRGTSIFDELETKYEELMKDEHLQAYALSREKFLRDQLHLNRQAVHEGFAEGLAQGIAEGREKGLTEGLALGLAEGKHKQALLTANALIKIGLPLQQISDATGLSEAELRLLSDEA